MSLSGPPPESTITLTDSGVSGSSVSCPVNYVGQSASASSTVSGTDAIAAALESGSVLGANAQANAGFEVSGIAPQDGFLPLDFVTSWNLLTDGSSAQMSVLFYFNGLQIGGFTQMHHGAGQTFPQETISQFVEPVQAGEAYTLGAQVMAEADGENSATATAEVQTAVPEPGTMFLVGIVSFAVILPRFCSGFRTNS